MNPDQNLLITIPGRIQNATAKGKDTECVSRSFCPKLSIAEDSVCDLQNSSNEADAEELVAVSLGK